MASKPTTVTEYLASLPADRRSAIEAVRAVVRKHLPKGYVEGLSAGWLAWSVPLEVYPDTYNGHPLMYVALVNQKNHIALHLVCAYMNPVLQAKLDAGFKAAGKKLDMGKGCVRFTRLEDLSLGTIAEVVAAVPMDKYVAIAKQAHSPEARRARSAKRATEKQGANTASPRKTSTRASEMKGTRSASQRKTAKRTTPARTAKPAKRSKVTKPK
jgi:hypothetical protein